MRLTKAGLASAIALVIAFSASEACADEPPMIRATRTYFGGELDEAAAFLGVGVGTAYIGASLIPTGDFGIGAGSAILPVSAIQIVAGLVLVVRTKRQVAELVRLHARDPRAFRAKELPRMQRVNTGFLIYQIAEISLLGIAGASIVFGVVDHRDGFVGAGVGLAVQSAGMLTFDLLASHRADVYTRAIERLTPAVLPVVTPTAPGNSVPTGGTVGVLGSF